MNHSRRVVLITGCSSGFGYLASLKFAQSGDQVIATMRDIECDGAKTLSEKAKNEMLDISIQKLDITKQEDIDDVDKYIQTNYGRVDVLINNAGFGFLGPILDFSIEELKEQFETNLYGTFRMIKAVTSMMITQKSGTIINISSINGLMSFPFFGVYSSSKFALETLTEALRFELNPFNVKVTLVEPGSFLTEFANKKKNPQASKSEDSPFKNISQNFFEKYEQAGNYGKNSFLQKLLNPQRVVDRIYLVSKQNNPRLHNIIGYDAYLYYWGRKILPRFAWEKLIIKIMGLG